MFDALVWLATAASIIGAVLNSRRKVCGFYFWIPANVAWIVIDCYAGLYGQALLFLFYLMMCFYGIYRWKKST